MRRRRAGRFRLSKKAATAGVEGGVIFEDGDGSFDRIDGRSATGKNGIAGFKRVADTGLVGGSHVGGDGHAPPWTSRVGVWWAGEVTGIS